MRPDPGFEKATSNNLPKIDVDMIAEYLNGNADFVGAEMRGTKSARSARETYGDSAIGYVTVCQETGKCTVKGKVTPEHRVRNQAYSVSLIVDERKDKICKLQCHDCAASAGGCKHAFAFLMWVHRRSEEPSPTEVACYWRKAQLATVGTTLKFVKISDIASTSSQPIVAPAIVGDFLKEFIDVSITENKSDDQLFRHFTASNGPISLSIHSLLNNYIGAKTGDAFIGFCKTEMNALLCQKAQDQTRSQSKSNLWFELRYGRITASKIHEAAHCKKADGSLTETIFGARAIDTPQMRRGRDLEKEVIEVVSEKLKIKIQASGLLLSSEYPIFGASPDGLTDTAVIEVKCPSTEKTFETYIKNNKIPPKHLAQMYIQMHFAGKQKAFFCVAHHDFSVSKEVKITEVSLDMQYLLKIIQKAEEFWKKAVFPKLLSSVGSKN